MKRYLTFAGVVVAFDDLVGLCRFGFACEALLRGLEALQLLPDHRQHLGGGVSGPEAVEVARRNEAAGEHLRLHPIDQAGPEARLEQEDRPALDQALLLQAVVAGREFEREEFRTRATVT